MFLSGTASDSRERDGRPGVQRAERQALLRVCHSERVRFCIRLLPVKTWVFLDASMAMLTVASSGTNSSLGISLSR